MSHIDPELLAAWADASLTDDEARAVDAHLADCAACRGVAAVLAATLDARDEDAGRDRGPSLAARGTVAHPSHSRERHAAPASQLSAVKWALPIAATLLVGSFVAWKYWPRPEAPVQMAVATPPAVVTPQSPAPAPPPPTPNGFVPIPGMTPKQAALTTKSQTKAPPKSQTESTESTKAIAAPPAPPPAPSMPPAPVASPPPAAAGAIQSAAAQAPPAVMPRIQAPVPPAVPRPAPPPPPQTIALDDRPRAAADSAMRTMSTGVAGGGGRGGAARPVAITSTPPLRWRVTAPAKIEISKDNGVTWSDVAIEAAGVELTSGNAPTADACWLVGRGGAVFLSKNGQAFKRLAFPDAVDLTAVFATDARRATVLTADGRSFVTEDEGQTWRIARF